MAEMAAKRERERQRFAEMEADVTGRGAQTVSAVWAVVVCVVADASRVPAAGLHPQWLVRDEGCRWPASLAVPINVLAHPPAPQVFRDKEGRRVSKEEYLEQQAAAKKKAQVGGAEVAQRQGGLVVAQQQWCLVEGRGGRAAALLTAACLKCCSGLRSTSRTALRQSICCAVLFPLCSTTARRSWSGAAA